MTINTAHDAVGDADALRRLERFGGLKLREELTTLFLQEAPARIATARVALASGDIEAVRAMAHMLKSSAGQMGALRVQIIAERLESPDHPPDLARALSDLDEELARYTVWLETAFLPPTSP
ncbi:MAG: Hpt domain-containing protein [Gemmatimonadaceae bacterium]|nr:Hpt domain-containing protein [Gemmatimonadaceae bacterium]